MTFTFNHRPSILAYTRDANGDEFFRLHLYEAGDAKTKEFMERTAPLNNASKIRKPMLITQGQNDLLQRVRPRGS
jgi:dipeptidyl aminopeptidase/acylaminoacyl peptidase